MFWDLKGATLKPRSERRRQRAATSVLLPEWEVVPRTTRKRDMGGARACKFICLLEGGVSKKKMGTEFDPEHKSNKICFISYFANQEL